MNGQPPTGVPTRRPWAGALVPLRLCWAPISAAAIIVYRVGRRAVMLSQRDKTAPDRGPRRGFWSALQVWAGWSR
ncbi:hypothetical protein [Streptomyces sp. NPDC058545]|uniref:hypothetical protein n=1 Tax=Streptomyces sp. NPDC058545 TaxID=3346544 RepID=UPI003649EB96